MGTSQGMVAARIRKRIREMKEARVVQYPVSADVSKRLARRGVDEDLAGDLDTDYREAIVEQLEWILREVLEVVP